MVFFFRLPAELIEKILTELLKSPKHGEVVSADLISLRQTCTKLRDYVTPHIFKTRHVMIEEASLESSVKISQRSDLAKHIRESQFHTLQLRPLQKTRPLEYCYVFDESETESTPSDWSSTSVDSEGFETTEGSHTSTSGDGTLSRLEEDTHRMYYEQQRELMTGGYAYDYLLNGMSKLKNCKKISFDGESPPWSQSRLEGSFGTLLERCLTGSAASDSFITQLLGIVLAPEVVRGIQIEYLEICIGYLMDDVFGLCLDQLPPLLAPIKSLRRLHLVIDNAFIENRLHDLLAFLPGLADFSLNVYGQPWFESSAGVISGLSIPNLQKLNLSMVNCIVEADDLENLICKHQETLKDISFISIMLPDDRSWYSVFEKILGLKTTNLYMEDCLKDAPRLADMEELRQHYQQLRMSSEHKANKVL
ncbi:hypothetical protein FLONG3_212 [Fusarium longipes]|uniref:Uncharacterized protein n=1 Tax=Fusarium longipes TaxID=694270 RepID=A0A395TAZ5_9HYPO|nr:hypothetical protein FLONG3_212 [Fusarium longipes]